MEVIANELEMMKISNDVENVVHFQECLYTQDSLYVIMDFMDGGCLADLLDEEAVVKLSTSEMAYIFRELLQGLDALHNLNLIHRDVKSDNVLFSSAGDVKLGQYFFEISLILY